MKKLSGSTNEFFSSTIQHAISTLTQGASLAVTTSNRFRFPLTFLKHTSHKIVDTLSCGKMARTKSEPVNIYKTGNQYFFMKQMQSSGTLIRLVGPRRSSLAEALEDKTIAYQLIPELPRNATTDEAMRLFHRRLEGKDAGTPSLPPVTPRAIMNTSPKPQGRYILSDSPNSGSEVSTPVRKRSADVFRVLGELVSFFSQDLDSNRKGKVLNEIECLIKRARTL